MPETGSNFRIRTAQLADVAALHRLIELSVRGLQTGDYTSRQIEGALGTALGLDTQLILDATYFIAFPAEQPDMFVELHHHWSHEWQHVFLRREGKEQRWLIASVDRSEPASGTANSGPFTASTIIQQTAGDNFDTTESSQPD